MQIGKTEGDFWKDNIVDWGCGRKDTFVQSYIVLYFLSVCIIK